MKLFLSPFKPLSYLATLAVLLVLVPLGRFYQGDGSLWTVFGGFALTVLFILAGILALAGKGQISQVKAPTGIVDEAKSTLTAVKSAVARGKYNATARSSIDASEIPSPAAPVAADGTSAPRRASGATERD